MRLDNVRNPLLLMAAALLATALIYGLALSGPFLFDDLQNIVGNPYVQPAQLDAASLRQAAGAYAGFPGRPISTISFAISYRISGLDAEAFRATNLLIHLLCGLTLYSLLRELLRAGHEQNVPAAPDTRRGAMIVAVATALWLLHPLQVSTVLYAVQRMTLLAALFSLLGLLAYVRMRRAQQSGALGALPALAVLACLVAGSLSKESGALLPLYCGLVEIALFRLRADRRVVRRMLRVVWLGGSAVAALAALVLLPAIANWLQQGYAGREFSLSERLLTQPRVLLLYLQLLLVPDLRAMTLYHDDFPISQSLWAPPGTLPALMLILAALAIAILGLFSRARLAALGIALFFAAHLLESSVVPLEMVFEHRNYLPSSGLLFGLVVLAATHLPPKLRPGLAVLSLLVLSVLCVQRTQLFSDPLSLVQHSLRYHPTSLRTQLWTGDTYREVAALMPGEQRRRYLEAALPHYRRAAELDPQDVIGLYSHLSLLAELGQSLDSGEYGELAHRLRHGSVRAGSILATQGFLESIAQGQSGFPPEDALTLADALLANPRCGGRGRAMVLSAAATVRAERLQDFTSAIAQSREAVQLQPQDPSLWIPLATILLKAGQPAEAEAAVLSALAVDGGAFRPSLTRFLATIREQLRPADTRPPSALP